MVSGSGVATLKGFRPSVSVLIWLGIGPVVKISDLGAVISPDASINVDPPLVPFGVLMMTMSALACPELRRNSPVPSPVTSLGSFAHRLV
ncbi:hypothetical protein [Cyanobium sp. Lug-B]|uniref:hypothetical protein n=1 Tax=Cyanobium sp. Lug-B TaxID=2823716 RepID=UPI0020CC1A25|nr:hypothetical protein [Cyanobium sp. Lug-B]